MSNCVTLAYRIHKNGRQYYAVNKVNSHNKVIKDTAFLKGRDAMHQFIFRKSIDKLLFESDQELTDLTFGK